MNKKQCREALDLYKKFLIRMDRVGEFLKVAENIGIDKGEIPDLTKVRIAISDWRNFSKTFWYSFKRLSIFCGRKFF